MVFGNRFYRTKLIGALAVVALLGVHAAKEGLTLNPAPWRCLAEPERWDGTELRTEGRVRDVVEGGFTLARTDARVKVTGVDVPVTEGDHVEIRGVFRAEGGPHIAATGTRATPPGSGARRWMEIVSMVVLLIVLINFVRRFSVHPKALQVGRGD